MTDSSRWRELVFVAKKRWWGAFSLEKGSSVWEEHMTWTSYAMIPLSDYQLGNVLAAVMDHKNDGDWWHEVQSILLLATEELGLYEVSANDGRTWLRTKEGWKEKPKP